MLRKKKVVGESAHTDNVGEVVQSPLGRKSKMGLKGVKGSEVTVTKEKRVNQMTNHQTIQRCLQLLMNWNQGMT